MGPAARMRGRDDLAKSGAEYRTICVRAGVNVMMRKSAVQSV